MKRIWKWTGIAGIACVLTGAVAYAATPGYHRALTPWAFEMTKAAPNLYVDDESKAPHMLGLIAKAEATTRAFFGELRADPTYIICTTQACRDSFDLRPAGLSLGYQLILLAPTGANEMILTHERIHAELHRFMGIRDIWDQRFPAWFDEGLASYLSNDTRTNRPENAREADWVKAAKGFRQWGALNRDGGWRDSYGAASRLIEEMVAHIGRDGLLDLIHQVADGADFDDTALRMIAEQ